MGSVGVRHLLSSDRGLGTDRGINLPVIGVAVPDRALSRPHRGARAAEEEDVRPLFRYLIALAPFVIVFFVTVLVVAIITRQTLSRALIEVLRSETLLTRSWFTVIALALAVSAALMLWALSTE